MQILEITLPPAANPARVKKVIDATLASAGLEVSLRGTLKQFPGCTHWHAKLAGQSGTLELTLWPEPHRAWISIQSGRTAEWITERLPKIREALDRKLAALHGM